MRKGYFWNVSILIKFHHFQNWVCVNSDTGLTLAKNLL